MNKNQLYKSLRSLCENTSVKVVQSILIMSLIIAPTMLLAQVQKSFKANNNEVDIASFNKEVKVILDEIGTPALSLAVISDNEIVFTNHYGYKELSKKNEIDENTVFEAASLTKSLLVFVVHELVDKGQLDLDKPLYQYLEYEPLAHDQRYKKITARMVLSHSSGIENWKRFNNPDTLEILANPGEKYVYSGEGYQYLAKVVAVILKKPYEEYIPEMVLKPLGMNGTFLAYTDSTPSNYAIGHDSFGKEMEKWKNKIPYPASGGHLNARDYAKLIISIFNNKYLSKQRIDDILQPTIQIEEDKPSLFYGLGFEVFYTPNDTIILHGGVNDGFRALMCYSIVSKSGLVILTNGDRGNLMFKKLCEMTIGLDLEDYFEGSFFVQYPSSTITLLKSYRDGGADRMFEKLEELKKNNDGEIKENTLNELGQAFFGYNWDMARKVVIENTKLYPKSNIAFYLLGQIYMVQEDFKLAYENLTKAHELDFNEFGIEYDIKTCAERMSE